MTTPKRPHSVARAWTRDEDAQLVALICDGYTIQAAARKLGRSSSSVATYLERQYRGAIALRRRTHRKRAS